MSEIRMPSYVRCLLDMYARYMFEVEIMKHWKFEHHSSMFCCSRVAN